MAVKRRGGGKSDFLIGLDPTSSLSLQNQIRRHIIAAIGSGIFLAGMRLPSSRRLARELKVARNTVTLAYQELVAQGHLRSSERSGVFVSQGVDRPALDLSSLAGRSDAATEDIVFAAKIKRKVSQGAAFRCPPDWQRYKYPFIQGRFDRSLFPVAEWREASRLALSVSEVAEWSNDAGEVDDESLIDQIRAKTLPKRGIFARRNEILIVANEQQALHLLALILMNATTRVAVEDPGLPQTRSVLGLGGARLHLQPVDDDGMIIDKRLDRCEFIHVTPSRQKPTGVTMSTARQEALLEMAGRRDALIIEDDSNHDSTFLGRPTPAMRALPGGNRVLYVANLCGALSPGVQLGLICGPPSIVSAARQIRDLATHRPSSSTQRAFAHFLALGHYDAMNSRLLRVTQARLTALRDALNHYLPQSIAHALPQSVAIAPVGGGTSVWVRGPEGLDARLLAVELERRGALIEPAADYYGGEPKPLNMFRMAITSLPIERIRPGVELIASVIRELTGGTEAIATGVHLRGDDLTKALCGATLLYRTVDGEPCTIELLPQGELRGRAGFANEESDSGTWRIENDKWYRCWRTWAYGEEVAFQVKSDGDRLFLLNEEGRWVDSVVMIRSHAKKALGSTKPD